MSLKAFHIFFIVCATFLTGWLAIWEIEIYGETRNIGALFSGIGLLAGAAGLAVYLLWFLKKNKKAGTK